jgi:hypothetical protein
MLDIGEIGRMIGVGRRWIEWTDEDGLLVGNAHIRALEADSLDFSFRFFGTTNLERSNGGVQASVRNIRVNENRSKQAICCPGCGRGVSRIYYAKSIWRCRSCHCFVPLTQRLNKVQRMLIGRDHLKMKLENTRETKRNSAERSVMQRKLDGITRLLFDEEVNELPEQLAYRSFGTWLGPDQVPVESINPHTIGYGWEPGDRRGIRGLYPEGSISAVSGSPTPTGPTSSGWGKPERGNASIPLDRIEAARQRLFDRQEEVRNSKLRVAPWIG